jgi:hypothetical protein
MVSSHQLISDHGRLGFVHDLGTDDRAAQTGHDQVSARVHE